MGGFTDPHMCQRAGSVPQNLSSNDAWRATAELAGADDADRAEVLLDLQMREMVLLSVVDDMPPALPPSLTRFLRWPSD